MEILNIHFLGSENAENSHLFTSFGMRAHVSGVTRLSDTTATQIDNIFSTMEGEGCASPIYPTDISDHYVQILTFKRSETEKDKVIYIKRRFFNVEDINKFVK